MVGSGTSNWGYDTGAWTYNSGSNATTTGTVLCDWIDSTATSSGPFQTARWTKIDLVPRTCTFVEMPLKIAAGKNTIELPDGAKLIVDDLGNYRIEDKDAKVTYQANRVREFSPHLNASDMLAQFVRYVGSLGVRQSEVLALPIELFINWLIIEAAERDKDPLPADVVPVPQHRAFQAAHRPKCLYCGRFIPRLHMRNRFAFCDVQHGIDYLAKVRPELIPQLLSSKPQEACLEMAP